jgi:AcrR family transcriptional regulator
MLRAPAPRRGRPRDPAVDDAVLTAALDLLLTEGYGKVSIEGVAARSGVGKQAIYRRWSGKGDLILDAFAARAERTAAPSDTGSLEGDLRGFLRTLFRALRGDAATINRALMAESLRDPAFGERFRERFVRERRAALKPMLERARERGELLASDEVVLDLLYGPMWYRVLVGHGDLDDAYADELATAITAAAAVAPR